jgi:predicted enzyme related to lactoylglutathione lyase
LERALNHGATKVGEISEKEVEGVGILTFIYIADPEGNLIELQNWRQKD